MTREFGPRVEDFSEADIPALKAEILTGWDIGVISIAKAMAVVRAQDKINADLLEALEAIEAVADNYYEGTDDGWAEVLNVTRTAIKKAS